MILTVDPDSPVPVFEQVRSQLADLVRAGTLAPGHRLPSIRQLASDLQLAPGTVARAYRELEAEGLVTSRVRHGTVVSAPGPASGDAAQSQLREAARTYALVALRLSVSREEAAGALTSQLDRVLGDRTVAD